MPGAGFIKAQKGLACFLVPNQFTYKYLHKDRYKKNGQLIFYNDLSVYNYIKNKACRLTSRSLLFWFCQTHRPVGSTGKPIR
jgi:hypothetical protein